MANGFDIWGVVASVLGLLSLFQLIAAVVNSRLPRQRLRTFDDTLEETEGLLRSVEEEGLFDDDGGQYLSSAKTRVANVCNRARRLRGDAFAAQTLSQEITQWWRGLSREIVVCCDDLKALRAQVSTTSNERRRALAQNRNDIVASNRSQRDPASTAELTRDSSSKAYAGPCKEDDEAHHLPPDDVDGIVSAIVGEPVPVVTASSLGIHSTPRPPLECTDTPPSYRRQSSLPSYTSSPPLSTTIITRYTVTSADARRATRKLVRAYRRNLMVHNVPWNPQGAPHPHRGPSAAGSAWAVDRPSNAPRHWKLLEARSNSRLRPCLTVLLHERSPRLCLSPHVTSTVGV